MGEQRSSAEARRPSANGLLKSGHQLTSSALAQPPDGGWGWVVVFSSFMIHVIADGVTYTFGIFYLEFLKHFQESKGKTAWIASIMVGTTFCVGPVASGLTTKYGCRAVTIAGSLMATAGLAVSVVAPNVTYLFFTIGLFTGAGFGLMYLPAIVSVTMYFEKRRAFATGIAVCGSGFGTFALAPFIEWLVHVYGWQGALLCTAGMVLNCCVFGALLRPLPAVVRHERAPPREINGNAYHATPGRLSSCSASRELSLSTGTIERSEPRRSARWSALLPTEEEAMSCLHIAGSTPPSPHARSLLVRKDIFYSGSLMNLPPEYRGSSSVLSRELSVTSLRTIKSVTVPLSDERSRIQRFLCSSEVEAALREMVNFGLLRSPVFLLFAASNLFTSVGFNVPYVYTKDRAVEDLQVPEETASLLLSCIGLSNTLGRVLLGYLSDKSCVNRLWLYNANLTVCGLATAFSYAARNGVSMAVYCVIFGATSGAFVSLTSVILVDILGLERLTNAFGLLLLFEGVACLVGPPVTGWLYDYTGSYDPGFFLSGAMIAFGGVMLFLIPCAQRCEEQSTATSTSKSGSSREETATTDMSNGTSSLNGPHNV
ncbi:monocarboxylate transporter 12-B-like [Amblyomma americanum]